MYYAFGKPPSLKSVTLAGQYVSEHENWKQLLIAVNSLIGNLDKLEIHIVCSVNNPLNCLKCRVGLNFHAIISKI